MKNIFYLTLLLLLSPSSIIAQIQTDIDWPTLANSDWPMIKHDPQFTGRSPYKGPQSATIIWAVDMPDGIFSGPVIGEGGHLFFGSYYQLDSADHFYSYTSDGILRWDYKSGTNRPPQAGVLIDSSNTIYFGSLDQYLYALNPNGSLKWKYNTGYITEILIPNIDREGKIYITNNPQGELLSIHPNGTLNWQVKYDSSGFLFKSPVFSPDGNTIYIAGKDSNLFALNLDGSLKWKYECGKITRAPIVDSFGNIYFAPFESPQYFYSLTPDGNIKWKNGDSFFGEYSIPSIDKNGNVYIIAIENNVPYYHSLRSFDPNGIFRWKYIFNDYENDDFWQPLMCDSEGTVYVGSTFGYYYYAICSDGQLKWKLPLNDYQVDNTGAISKDGTLYLGVHKSSFFHHNEKNLIAIWDTTTTGINDEIRVVTDYCLFQNYPNPFNPSTKISWQSPAGSWQNLKVYDILGREITTLVNEYKPAGKYEVNWDATNLPCGVYFYRLQAGDFVETKKMLLLK